jgi:Leucine-rich repeat (LRR) protein
MNFLNLKGNLDLCKLEINSTQHLKKIILSDCGLTSLPQFVKESKLCEFLDLEGNKLNEDSTDFKGLTNLLDLNLNKNKFTTVPPSIYDLKKLKSLAISRQIKTIDHDIKNLKQLKEIHLGWNDNTLRKHYFLLKNLKDIR